MNDTAPTLTAVSACDHCGGAVRFIRTPIGDGPFTELVPMVPGSGSDHLAVWCAACGPLHRNPWPVAPSTCRWCGVTIRYSERFTEWHRAGDGLLNACANHQGGHAPLTESERVGAMTAPYRSPRFTPAASRGDVWDTNGRTL